MSRSAFEIASTAVGDLLEVQKSFENTKLIFDLILKRTPQDSTVYALAELGMLDVSQWENKVMDWCVVMDDELDDFPEQADAHRLKSFRREALRAGGEA